MKKPLIWLIILVMVLSPISFAQSSQLPKQEVVYAKMAYDGSVDLLSVVNVFRLSTNGVVRDYGNYQEIVNLTNLEPMETTGDKITVRAETGVFYYQGNSPDKQLPWLIEIEYALDGKQVEAQELAGANGELTIHMQVKPNPEADPVFFENYLLQVSFQFPQENFKLMTAKDATEAINGEDKMLTYTVLPEKEADITITAHVTDFAMKPITLNGLPFQMAIELPDMDDSLDDLILLQDAINQLNQGAQSLADGLGQVGSGGNQLLGGADGLAGAGHQMSEGLSQFNDGLSQYHSGLEDYRDGVVQFDTGLGQLVDGLVELSNGLSQYAAGSDTATAGLNQYIDGVDAYVGGVNQALDMVMPLVAELDQVKELLDEIDFSEAIEESRNASDQIDQALGQVAETLEQMDLSQFDDMKNDSAALLALLEGVDSQTGAVAGLTDLIARLQTANQNLDTNLIALKGVAYNLRNPDMKSLGVDPKNPNTLSLMAYMSSQAKQIYGAVDQIRTGTIDPINQTIDDLSLLNATIQQALTGLSGLAESYRPIDSMIQSFDSANMQELKEQALAASETYHQLNEQFQDYMNDMGQDLPDALKQAVDGMDQAIGGMQQLRDGGDQIIAGGSEIRTGFGQLNQGAHELSNGSGELVIGARQIRTGSSELTNGIRLLADNFGLMIDGSSQINWGLQQLADGLTTYRNGLGAYVSGIYQVGDGSRQLADGTDQLARETDGLDDMFREQIEQMTEEFLPNDFEAVSFVSDKNKQVEVVQFVIMGHAINMPDNGEVENDDRIEKTIWDRILDLFKELTP